MAPKATFDELWHQLGQELAQVIAEDFMPATDLTFFMKPVTVQTTPDFSPFDSSKSWLIKTRPEVIKEDWIT
jgi:hypothetical protein